jgi:hypothetical protein
MLQINSQSTIPIYGHWFSVSDPVKGSWVVTAFPLLSVTIFPWELVIVTGLTGSVTGFPFESVAIVTCSVTGVPLTSEIIQ